MGAIQNSMLGAVRSVGVAAGAMKVAKAMSEHQNQAAIAEEEAAKKEATSKAIDQTNMEADLARAELEGDTLRKEQEQNTFDTALAREGSFFAQGKNKQKKLTNLDALRKSAESLAIEVQANEIRVNQIKKVMALKGFGGER